MVCVKMTYFHRFFRTIPGVLNSINSIVTVRYSPLLTETNSVISDKELNVFEHFSLQRQGGMQAHRRSKYTYKVCNIIIWCCKDAALRKLGLNFRPLKDKECED